MCTMNLLEVFQNLKMDNNTVETSKAMDYLKRHKEFRSDIGDSFGNVFDCYGSKVICLPFNEFFDLYRNTQIQNIQDDLVEMRINGLEKLASEIEKETDLICQLELLIRKIPARETKVSIHLIVQHLLYLSENEVKSAEEVVFMYNDTPLLALGCMLQSLKLSEFIYILATDATAPICYLFTELCRKAGLDYVKLVIQEEKYLIGQKLPFVTYSKLFEGLPPEVVGVISDKSDADSAVEAFLNSEEHPFPLTRIFVQESIYKEFRVIIAWKCRFQQDSNPSLKVYSTDAFKYGHKTIYLDYAGTAEELKKQKDHLILVEAYRTTKELLTFLNTTEKRLCLSVWASGISEANEIALKVSIPVVWINDYCNFDGPNAVSQAIFDKTHQYASYVCDEDELKRLIQQQKSWASLSFNERYKKVLQAFNSVDENLGYAIKEEIGSYWKLDEFISVQNNTMIMGFTAPSPIFGLNWGDECNTKDEKQVWVDVAKILTNGSAIACWVYKNQRIISMFDKLASSGLPVRDLDASDLDSNSKPHVIYRNYPEIGQCRVIWTSFGTTFAN